MREVEIDSEAKLSEVVEQIRATHLYLTGKVMCLTGITLDFVESESSCPRTFHIGSKSSDIE